MTKDEFGPAAYAYAAKREIERVEVINRMKADGKTEQEILVAFLEQEFRADLAKGAP